MSSSKAKKLLKLINTISLDKGLDETILWYKENFKHLKIKRSIIFTKNEKFN